MATLNDLLTSRIPPHSLEAERAVLGLCLLDPAALARTIEQCTATDLYKEGHRKILAAMLDVLDRGGLVDPLTLTEECRRQQTLEEVGGPAYLGLLVEEATLLPHLDRYLDIVRDHALAREVIRQATEIIGSAYEGTTGPGLLTALTEQLERLTARRAAALRPFEALSVQQLLATEIPDPDFLVTGWLPAKALSFVVGDSEAYKSWFTLYLALCVAAGVTLFGRLPVRQAPTLVISEENGLAEDKRRVRVLCRALGLTAPPCFVLSEQAFSFDDPAKFAALRAFVAQERLGLIVVDSFVRVHRRKENDAGEMNALYLDRIKPLLHDGAALCLLHHRRKAQAQLGGQAAPSDSDEIRGSGDIRAATHSVLFLRTVSDTMVLVKHNKTRGFKRQEPFVFSIRDTDVGGVELAWEGKPEDALDKTGDVKSAILLFAEQRGTFTRTELAAALKGKYSKKVFDPVLAGLSANSYPLKKDKAGRKDFYTFVSARPDPDAFGDANDDGVASSDLFPPESPERELPW